MAKTSDIERRQAAAGASADVAYRRKRPVPILAAIERYKRAKEKMNLWTGILWKKQEVLFSQAS